MPWDEDTNKELKVQIESADLIERCQTLMLITPDERQAYIEKLNGYVHKAIENILAQV